MPDLICFAQVCVQAALPKPTERCVDTPAEVDGILTQWRRSLRALAVEERDEHLSNPLSHLTRDLSEALQLDEICQQALARESVHRGRRAREGSSSASSAAQDARFPNHRLSTQEAPPAADLKVQDKTYGNDSNGTNTTDSEGDDGAEQPADSVGSHSEEHAGDSFTS